METFIIPSHPLSKVSKEQKQDRTIEVLNNRLPLTAFGDFRTAELNPIFQGSFEYTVNNTELIENVAVAPASVTQSNGMAVVSTSTTTGKRVSLQSHVHGRYAAGFGGLGRFTALFTTSAANTEQWVGLADEYGSVSSFKNGLTVGFNGTSFGIARFQNDAMTFIPQTEFNDKLDGTGASRMVYDPTKLNVFEVRYQYLGGGAITFHIEDDSTGDFVEFHRVLYANLNTSPSTYNPNYHFFIYANNKATTTDLVVKSASYGFFIEGKTELILYHQPQFSSSVVTKNAVTTEIALLTIKCKTTYASKTNFIPILLEYVSCSVEAAAANNQAVLRIIKNATLGGTPSYVDIDTNNSVSSIDSSGTTVTGGKELMAFSLAGKNDKLNESVLPLKFILQDGDTITLAVSSVNSATFKGNVLWKELF